MARSNPEIVMTTEKDAVKLREWFTKDDPVWFLATELEFLSGEQQILELLDGVGIE
jgi:tetraacyldisaccharide-1-P 4'-kinase